MLSRFGWRLMFWALWSMAACFFAVALVVLAAPGHQVGGTLDTVLSVWLFASMFSAVVGAGLGSWR